MQGNRPDHFQQKKVQLSGHRRNSLRHSCSSQNSNTLPVVVASCTVSTLSFFILLIRQPWCTLSNNKGQQTSQRSEWRPQFTACKLTTTVPCPPPPPSRRCTQLELLFPFLLVRCLQVLNERQIIIWNGKKQFATIARTRRRELV